MTGASSGIGLAIAHMLSDEGFALTIAARGEERLHKTAEELRKHGSPVNAVVANVASESDIQALVAAHRERYGCLELLVNNAGMGVVGPNADARTSHMDLQYEVNLRSIAVLYRETADLLEQAAAADGPAIVVNVASIAGKVGEGGLAMYSAVKHGVVGLTQAMNQELHERGIRSCVLCPAFVDTPLSDYMKHLVPGDQMIQSSDLAEAVRFLTRISNRCVVPEIMFQLPGDRAPAG